MFSSSCTKDSQPFRKYWHFLHLVICYRPVNKLKKAQSTTIKQMILPLDETVDPCDDFDNFACGSFIENTVIPDDKTSVSMFSVLGDKLNQQVCLVFYL